MEKYSHYSSEATDPKLSELFSEIGSTEQQHLKTVNGMLSGTAPSLKQTQQNETASKTPGRKPKKKNTNEQDAYLCSDVLSTEKHVSAVYNTSIFEFAQPDLRE
ncbi:MAG: spore coat protein, partial [Pygmaiobacter sp.]